MTSKMSAHFIEDAKVLSNYTQKIRVKSSRTMVLGVSAWASYYLDNSRARTYCGGHLDIFLSIISNFFFPLFQRGLNIY